MNLHESMSEAYMGKVEEEDGCWLWQGSKRQANTGSLEAIGEEEELEDVAKEEDGEENLKKSRTAPFDHILQNLQFW